MTDSTKLTRRQFLQATGAAALGLTLGRLVLRADFAHAGAPVPVRYEKWQDVYRERWKWDRVAKGTHHVNCWYQRGCNWNVYVKDGVVLREEQAGIYPQTNADVPDYNPRGCQKGGCYSHRMYDPGRITHPLKRVGRRGQGRWKRVSWEEALDDIADRMIDVLVTDGPGSIYWDFGTSFTNGGHGVGVVRNNFVLDSIMLDANAEIGDHHPGAAVTTGKICYASSADDWFYSDLVLIWGGNPIYTQIPNAHFLTETRYNGATVVTIAPDYSASSIHSDLWVPVEMGTDAALGLSLAHVIIEEGLFDRDFVREQTDLPLLVRKDNGLLLRERDFTKGGADDVFYFFDEAADRVEPAPRRSLELGGRRPALEGEFTVRTADGPVTVEPVFARLRRHLARYKPEEAAKVTGTPPSLIRKLARMIGRARAATIMTESNFSKYYHGMEMERAQILVLALCGHIGKKGAGMNAFPWLTVEAPEAAGVAPVMPLKLGMIALGVEKAPAILKAKAEGKTWEMFLVEQAREEYRRGGFVPSPLFFHQFGMQARTGSAKRWDRSLPREMSEYLAEAKAKGWQVVPETEPKIFFSVGGNFLRRVRGYPELIDNFLPRLDLFVVVDWRMSTTALYGDYVLPAAAWYERDDITWATPHAPFCQVTTKAVEPLGEAKSDWAIHCLFMKHIEKRAKQRGIRTFRDRSGKERRLDQVYYRMTYGGRYTEENGEEFLRALLEVNTNLGGVTWDELKEKGFARFTALGSSPVNIGNATDIEPNETITANTWHVRDKQPWPTLTRRMQFYIDHPFYRELGEVLPVHKDNPPIGGDYPLKMTGGHTRWSIHASWRDNPLMLRLQRGRPVAFIHPRDAAERGIEDGDLVRVRNDLGSFEVEAKIAPSMRPGQVAVYHAWEPHQFKHRRSHQSIVATPLNPIQLAGGYYHLQPLMIMGEPGMNDRGTRIELEPVKRRRERPWA